MIHFVSSIIVRHAARARIEEIKSEQRERRRAKKRDARRAAGHQSGGLRHADRTPDG